MKKKTLDNFTNDQLSRWPLARDNYRALKNAEVRTMQIRGLTVKLQHNPARIVSTAAAVDKDSVRRRQCFLCREHRPAEQISLKFEGRKGKRYDILVNPYPIFPEHLVIASDRHCDQSIAKRYVDMLDLAKAYQKHTFMYNGPKCGASAPDHHHFQAVPRGMLPLEADVDALFESTGGEGVLDYLASVKEAELYHYRRFANGIFVLKARTAKSMAKLFYRLLDCAPLRQVDIEPMFNLITWYSGGEYRSAVMFRDRHRPHNYFSEGPDHLMISPGCADMAGFLVVPEEEDYRKIDGKMLEAVLDEVALSGEDEALIVNRLVRTQPRLSVGIMSASEIVFEILSDGAGVRKAVYREGKIEYDGALYDELYFEEQTLSTMFAEAGFVLHDVTIGVGFHWERKENQSFAGVLKIVVSRQSLLAINIIGVEDYLLSVISSEMKSTSSEEFLKAHAVISRSWVMSKICGRASSGPADVPAWMNSLPAIVTHLDSVRNASGTDSRDSMECIRWYDHEDHREFDVCADDHCQRYQGLTRAVGETVRRAVDATWGEVLEYGGKICDARFSKCCGGMTERFSTCWDDRDYPYLAPVPDTPEAVSQDCGVPLPDLSVEENARKWIVSPEETGASSSFCNTSDAGILSQVLNDYDMETPDFFRWRVSYGIRELSALVAERSGHDIGMVRALVPEHRGASGRIDRLRIVGTSGTLVAGKELEIRRMLSPSHLKSSAFTVEYYDAVGMKLPSEAVEKAAMEGCGDICAEVMTVVLAGAGWGHGVGLCQIGAAVMASEGYDYRSILSHYYPGAELNRQKS